jgi:hypothetical protein
MTFELVPLRRSYGRDTVHWGDYFKGKYGNTSGRDKVELALLSEMDKNLWKKLFTKKGRFC